MSSTSDRTRGATASSARGRSGVDLAVRLGIRAQLSVVLGALLLLALAPLYVAVDGLTRAHTAQERERHARALGRAIAGHVGEARAGRDAARLEAMLTAQLGDGVAAVALYDRAGTLEAAVGDERDRGHLPRAVTPAHDTVMAVTTARGPGLVVVVFAARSTVATLLDTDPTSSRAGPVVRLVALYMALLGLVLLALSYFALTRIVVGPVARLASAAQRVADGARALNVPETSNRELAELGRAFDTMTKKLRTEEEALRASLHELGTRTTELARAEASVVRSEKLASVGRLAAGLAHEIGNPIAAILSMQELLESSEHLDDEEREFVVRMKRETERISRVLRDLLSFARPDRAGALAQGQGAGARDAAQGPSSVCDAVEHVAQLLRPQSSFRDVELSVSVPASLPAVAIGADQLEQVLVNLLINAADVVPASGGTISVTATETALGVALAVEDNGGGISASARDRIFEPFFTTKEIGKGTGLGLAVCRGLVEGAGGSIRLEEGDEGARFVLELARAS